MGAESKKSRVTLVSSDYQPSKADLEAPINVRKEDSSPPTMEELAQVVVRSVEIDWTKRFE